MKDTKFYFYRLKEDKTIEAHKDLLEWGDLLEDIEGRRVAFTRVEGVGHVSTVFMGLNLNLWSEEPVCFESMQVRTVDWIIEGDGTEAKRVPQSCDSFRRYKTWDEAVKGHAELVEELEELRRINQSGVDRTGKEPPHDESQREEPKEKSNTGTDPDEPYLRAGS